jgi:hypothetical protein
MDYAESKKYDKILPKLANVLIEMILHIQYQQIWSVCIRILDFRRM